PTTSIYTLSLHDALPILRDCSALPSSQIHFYSDLLPVRQSTRQRRENWRKLQRSNWKNMQEKCSRRAAILGTSQLRRSVSRISRDRKSTRLNSSHVSISY